MNQVNIMGRMTSKPELRRIPGKEIPVVNFTVAVDKKRKNEDGNRDAEFIPVVIFGRTAEFIATYGEKSSIIAISGYLQSRNYESKDGSKHFLMEVVASSVELPPPRRNKNVTSESDKETEMMYSESDDNNNIADFKELADMLS